MRSNVEIKKSLLLISSASAFVRRVLGLTVLFWMWQYLIRRIPAEEFVLYPISMGIVALMPLVQVALASGLGRYLTEAYARGDARRVTEITSTLTPVLVAAAAGLLLLAGAFAWHIELFLDIAPGQAETAQLLFMLLVIPIALRIACGPYLLGFYVRQRFVQRDLIGVGADLLRMALLVYLLTAREPGVLAIGVSALIATSVETCVVLVYSMRLLPALRFRLDAMRGEVGRQVLSFGGWYGVDQAATVLREIADLVVLNNVGTPSDVVTFSLGAQVDRSSRRTIIGSTSVAQPAATAMATTEQDDKLRRTYFRVCRYTLWVMMAVAVPFILYRTEFCRLYLGAKFDANAAAPLVLALLLARFTTIFTKPGIALLAVARERIQEVTLRNLALQGTSFALMLVLVAAYGMGSVGAALAVFVVAVTLEPLLLWRFGLRLARADLREFLRASALAGLLPALFAAPVWLLLQLAVSPDTWLELVGCAAGGWLVYGATLVATARPEDRADFAEAFRRVRGRLGAC